MRVRTSRTLVFTPDEEVLVGCNFLTRNVFGCDSATLDRLTGAKDWADFNTVVDRSFGGDKSLVEELIQHDAVVVAGSALEKRERQYLRDWRWTVPAGLMHFTLEDVDYMSLEEGEELQQQHLAHERQPSLFRRNRNRLPVSPLPSSLDRSDLLQLMARRRTVRATAKPSISVEQLADCLFAGMGITGYTQNRVGRLPLGMTPSGGARNPFEAYVLCRNVEGLAAGIYHYSAVDHDLGRLKGEEVPAFSSLLGGQDWCDEMPCLILLVADLRRTMWKYQDANAYRVVLIEAGHIGQNIMLAATEHGLSACPTAALCHSRIRETLGLRRVTDAPTYALTLAVPGIEAATTFTAG